MTQEEFKASVRAGLTGWYGTSQTEDSAVERIWKNREEFRALVEPLKREGLPELLDYLDECGFYYRPSSDTRHHNYPGGLAEHCLGVYKKMTIAPIAKEKPESVKIVGLFHDLCKCDQFYFEGRKIRSHRVNGHGSRSVRLLRKFGVKLDEYEYRAIRYHMGSPWSRKRREDPEFVKAVGEPLRQAVSSADVGDSCLSDIQNKLFKKLRDIL